MNEQLMGDYVVVGFVVFIMCLCIYLLGKRVEYWKEIGIY